MSAAATRLRAANHTIDWAHDVLSMSYGSIGEAIGAHRRTVARWRAGTVAPSRRHREAMEKLRVLRFLLESLFEDNDDAREWLHSYVPMLRGRSPISLIEAGEAERVVGVLAGLESGAVA